MKEILIGNHELQKQNRALFYGENFFTSFSTYNRNILFEENHFLRLKNGLNFLYPKLIVENTISEGLNFVKDYVSEIEGNSYVRCTPLVSLDKKNFTLQINLKNYENINLKKVKLWPIKKTWQKRPFSKIAKLGHYAEDFYYKENFLILKLQTKV